jgi:hypothetical protein
MRIIILYKEETYLQNFFGPTHPIQKGRDWGRWYCHCTADIEPPRDHL